MAGILTFKELQEAVRAGEIDTVVACFPDMQGRLVGKRFPGSPRLWICRASTARWCKRFISPPAGLEGSR